MKAQRPFYEIVQKQKIKASNNILQRFESQK
jgi:hypothetical protein